MNTIQKIWTGVAVVMVVILAVYFFQKPSQGAVIKIGVAAAMTGDAAEWGQGELNVVQMYVDDVNKSGGINGTPIALVVEDSKATGEGTVSAVLKLISVDKVPAIIGPTWADSFQGGNSIAENANVVLLTPSAALEVIEHKENFSYLFSTFWPQAPEIETMTRFMADHGMKTLAIINDHDTYDTKFSDQLAATAEAKGLVVVDHETLPIDTNDFRTEILKIKQLRADAIFVEINNVAGLGPFMKQVRQLGLSARVFTTADAQNQDAVSKFGTAMEGMTYPFPQAPTGTVYDDFVREYQARYHILPSTPSAITAYNAIVALVAVLKKGARTGAEIRDGLRSVKAVGIGEPTSFNAMGGISQADFDMKMIHDGNFVKLPE